MNDIHALVIGLGSMGKRRIRNLQTLGVKNISGFDPRQDRRDEAARLYNINVFDSFEKARAGKQNIWIISTPPDMHHVYMKESIRFKVPSFIEASVVDTDMDTITKEAAAKEVFLAPSCTFFFHPAIKLIRQIIASNQLGQISNVLYHAGQYLPDWHTYEPVQDYYVSKKETGGAREIVPFELTWLTKVFGFPTRVACFYKKTINIKGAENIEDTYNLLLDYDKYIINLTVDVVSRYATRRLLINGLLGQLEWNWDSNFIRIYSAETTKWTDIPFETAPAETGYNKNITEQMYIDEMQAFIDAALKNADYPNSLEEDHQVLKLLYTAEETSGLNKILTF